MAWHKVNLNPPAPVAIGRPQALPQDLDGIVRAGLADLSSLAPGRPDLDHIGWWPVVEVDEDLAQARVDAETKVVEVSRPISSRKAALLAAIGAAYQARIAAGFDYDDGNVVQIDEASQARITGVAARASAARAGDTTWDTGFAWRLADNSWMPLAAATDMITFASAVADYVAGIRVRYWALKDAVAAAEDHADLDAIDIASGWPATGYPG